MFKKQHKKSSGIVGIFRLLLSLMIFAILATGVYSAYTHFSGVDPLDFDPQSIVSSLIAGDLGAILPSSFSEQVRNKVDKKLQTGSNPDQSSSEETSTPKAMFNFMIMADSHNDNSYLRSLLASAKKYDVKFVLGLGDYTDVGTLDELKKAKNEFDTAGIRYFLIPGDHDLWDSRDKSLPPNSNFRQVFGPSYQSFIFDNFRFIMINNSDNYIGVDDEQMAWIKSELEKAENEGNKSIYVFVHQPLYHPSSEHVMGKVEGVLKEQAKSLIEIFREAKVKKIFAGDIHFFSEYVEPQSQIPMVTIGAVTTQRNSQSPRFAIVTVYQDGSTKVEDVEIR